MTLSGFILNNVPLKPEYWTSELKVDLIYYLVGSEVKISLSDGTWVQGILSYEAGDLHINPFSGVVRLLKSNGQLLARVDVLRISVVRIINPGQRYKEAWVAQYNLNYPQLPAGTAPDGAVPPWSGTADKVIWVVFGVLALMIVISIIRRD